MLASRKPDESGADMQATSHASNETSCNYDEWAKMAGWQGLGGLHSGQHLQPQPLHHTMRPCGPSETSVHLLAIIPAMYCSLYRLPRVVAEVTRSAMRVIRQPTLSSGTTRPLAGVPRPILTPTLLGASQRAISPCSSTARPLTMEASPSASEVEALRAQIAQLEVHEFSFNRIHLTASKSCLTDRRAPTPMEACAWRSRFHPDWSTTGNLEGEGEGLGHCPPLLAYLQQDFCLDDPMRGRRGTLAGTQLGLRVYEHDHTGASIISIMLLPSQIGQTLRVGGWVKTGREAGAGAFCFLEVNDGSSFESIQVCSPPMHCNLRLCVA